MIFLVDASVYVFRAYYSMPPDMLDRDGNPAHALFGFARFLGDLIERMRPRHIAVAFDESLTSSFRNRIYPAYKANRDPAPRDLALQFRSCREFCVLAGIAEFGSGEYEADDVIGTLACRMRREGLRSTLVTRDKDLAQLIREGDVYWDYTSREQFRYHEIEGRFGVPPERFADYLALTGDAVDNIRGVPGIGPKTAASLLRAFASLEELYDKLDQVPKLKLRRAGELPSILREHREAAFLARRLTAIACDLPLVADADALRRRLPDVPALTGFYDRHNFGPMLRRQTERLAELPLH
ncbi:MAG TPA: 5'-3' exonuclease H3TH domain-containing protein [Steroidobacteraceae bacterium]|nr:5'-3' exonuclease H3TH domain-containing protein [Steroidobacteraceae bacterium]